MVQRVHRKVPVLISSNPFPFFLGIISVPPALLFPFPHSLSNFWSLSFKTVELGDNA